MFLFKRLGFFLVLFKKYFIIFYYKIIIMNICFKKMKYWDFEIGFFLLCFILNNGFKYIFGKFWKKFNMFWIWVLIGKFFIMIRVGGFVCVI